MLRNRMLLSAALVAVAAVPVAGAETTKSIPSQNGFAQDFGKVVAGDFLAVNVQPDSGYSIWNNIVRNPRESGWQGGPRYTFTVPADFTGNLGLFQGNYGRPGGGGGTSPQWSGSAKAAAKVLRPGSPNVQFTPIDIEALAHNREDFTDSPAPQAQAWKVSYQDSGDVGNDIAAVTAKLTFRIRCIASVHRPFYDFFGSGEAACAAFSYCEGALVQQAQAARATSGSTFTLPIWNPITQSVGSIPIPIQTGNGISNDIKPDALITKTMASAVHHAPGSLLGPYQATASGVAVAHSRILVNLAIRASALANVQVLDASSVANPKTIDWTYAQ